MKRNVCAFLLVTLAHAGPFGCSAGAEPGEGERRVLQDDPAGPAGADVAEVRVEGARLAFRDEDSFYKTITHLSNLSERELADWERTFNIASYRKRLDEVGRAGGERLSAADEEFSYFPEPYLTVLNTDGEVQIGDSVVWYDRGLRHFVPAADAALLRQVKQDPALSPRKEAYLIVPVGDGGVGETADLAGAGGLDGLTVDLGLGSLDARHQREFYYLNDSGSRRKYVHELYSFVETASFKDPLFGPGYSYHSILYLRIKLEWRGCCSWKPAGESRHINYGLNYNVRLVNMHVPPFIAVPNASPWYQGFSSQSTTRSSALSVVLQQVSGNQFTAANGGNPYWQVEVAGSIYQHIVGDVASNAWTNSGQALW